MGIGEEKQGCFILHNSGVGGLFYTARAVNGAQEGYKAVLMPILQLHI